MSLLFRIGRNSLPHGRGLPRRFTSALCRSTPCCPYWQRNVGNTSRPRRPIPKRATRTADIAALTKEMMQHVRDARDYAVTTRDRTGTLELLPRPSQKALARRLGLSEPSVSRCMRDETARELKFLWELALDVDRLVSFRT